MSNFPPAAIVEGDIPTVEVNGTLIKAALKIAGKNDIRHYLNYVVIERGEFGTVLVVTDGHRLGVARLDCMAVPSSRHFFPRQPLSSTIISTRNTYQIAFPQVGYAYIHGEYCDIPEARDMAGAKFPDWRNIMPQRMNLAESARNPQYNPLYVQQAHDFVNAHYGVGKQKIVSNVLLSGADNSSCVVVHESFAKQEPTALVVVMPIRANDTNKGVYVAPAFCRNEKQAKLAEKAAIEDKPKSQ